MRLLKPFFRLPVRFDAQRLRAEVESLPASAWAKHPNHIEGNSSVRLISVDGGENDDVNGTMLPTRHLEKLPYIRQVLASFGVVWSRSRLLRLAPGAGVPQHADINYHWFNRVRMHIPVITRPEVRFYCDDQSVHMAAGEAWVFDNWRLHRVENPTSDERIHLVADTSGSANFWQLVAQSEARNVKVQDLPFDPARTVQLLTERTPLAPVMSPGEIDLLVNDLRGELAAGNDSPGERHRLARYHTLLDALCRDWRQLYALYGAEKEGLEEFARLRDKARSASRSLGEGLILRTNRVAAHSVLEGRVLRAMLALPGDAPTRPATHRAQPASESTRGPLRRPIFIVAAPRSGSTLLFETLAVSHEICTVGGEGHLLVESMPDLQPGAPGVESNRLVAEHATAAVAEQIRAQILNQLRDSLGRPISNDAHLRFLEKTPKNALRIPFFDRIFPDALFIFLWRDPRENLGSIIDAWRSGKWKTYNGLDGFEGPWSLLLPPGWRALNVRPLEEIASYQWESANRIVLDDLAALPSERWTAVQYAELISNPRVTVQRLCAFAEIEFDDALAQRVAAPLHRSRHTLTPPEPDKWRRHESEIARVLPALEPTWQRLRRLREAAAGRSS
jgi:hypothetical protein